MVGAIDSGAAVFAGLILSQVISAIGCGRNKQNAGLLILKPT